VFYSDTKIRRMIMQEGMITDYGSIDDQLQPNGFDFRVGKVEGFPYASGFLGKSEKKSTNLIDMEPLPRTLSFDDDPDFTFSGTLWELKRGAYRITFLETVKIPSNALGLGRPRSSLCRNGVSLHTGVWDAGYEGKSTALLVVHGPIFYLEPESRVMQMVFADLDDASEELYSGQYQYENIPHKMTTWDQEPTIEDALEVSEV